MLPGWYGFGAAVRAWQARRGRDGMDTLRRMYREWPFFTTTLSNMDMVLAKSDLAIASRYAELVADVGLRDAIFARFKAEWHDSVEAVLAITGQAALLEGNPSLARSIRALNSGVPEQDRAAAHACKLRRLHDRQNHPMELPAADGSVESMSELLDELERVRDRQEKIIALLRKSSLRPDVRFTLDDAIKQAEHDLDGYNALLTRYGRSGNAARP